MTVSVAQLCQSDAPWTPYRDSISVGRDILELPSISMYVDPMTIYREYIQNAADAIDEARTLGLLTPSMRGRVDINVDSVNRTIRIRDNGLGIPADEFSKRLTAFGASPKRRSRARGFRGLGRLAGIGYCQELVFRSRGAGGDKVKELMWDCRKVKASLRSNDSDGDLSDLVKQVVDTRQIEGREFPHRFFEVELRGIVRHRNDCLLNPIAIEDYLSQVGPVPFSPDFAFGPQIEAALESHVPLGNLELWIDGLRSPVFRPHRNDFEIAKGVFDKFTELELIHVPALDGGVAAVGWVLHHCYKGAIPARLKIKGLRVRSGNIQVGEDEVLAGLFPEQRFNSWAVGEIHVIDRRIVPNGRRDQFEQNVHFHNLTAHISPLARAISSRCRTSSIMRNWLRQFARERTNAREMIGIIRQGSVGATRKAKLVGEIRQSLEAMEKIAARPALAPQAKKGLHRAICRLRKELGQTLRTKYKDKRLAQMPAHLRRACEQVFGLIYECSSNRAAAKALVHKILVRLG